jgi:hypothetical protein
MSGKTVVPLVRKYEIAIVMQIKCPDAGVTGQIEMLRLYLIELMPKRLPAVY